MSLITSCPACTTLFKVVPDQLRISEGWVRCGHCSHVFDANLRLQNAQAEVVLVESMPSPDAAQTHGYPPFVLRRDDSAPVQPIERVQMADRPAPAVAAPVFNAPRSEQRDARDSQDSRDSQFGPSSVPSRWNEPDPIAVAIPDRSSHTVGAATDSAAVDVPDLQEDVSFVQQARRQAFWRGGAVRFILGLLALSLAGLLALQAAVQQRDWLASAWPESRPWLEALCQPLGCSVGAWRNIDAVVIDSSSFTRAAGDAYRLQFTLRNQAPVDVAVPALELTLTDLQEQTVLRRVLRPAELGSRVPATLAPSAEWSGSLTLSVANASSNASAGRVSGYRVLAFYP